MDMGEIASIAEHISATERNAADAEIDAAQMKKLEFFQRQLDQRNPQIFRAAIVDVRNYGLMVELPDALITGLIHVSSLTDDFYLFEPARRQLIGRRSRKRFKIGDELSVFVARVDTFKRQIDFAIAPTLASAEERFASRTSKAVFVALTLNSFVDTSCALRRICLEEAPNLITYNRDETVVHFFKQPETPRLLSCRAESRHLSKLNTRAENSKRLNSFVSRLSRRYPRGITFHVARPARSIPRLRSASLGMTSR